MIKQLNEQMEAGHAKENVWELAAGPNGAAGGGGTGSGVQWTPSHHSSPAQERSQSPVPEPVFINKMEPKSGCGLGGRGPPGAPDHLPNCPPELFTPII